MATTQEQQLIQGQGATLVSYPPRLAKAASVTARVSTPSSDMPDVGVAAVVDSVTATTAEDAPRGSSVILLASNVAIVRGRRYVLVDIETGTRVVVESAVGGTTNALKTVSPLPSKIAYGSSLVGYACTFALDAATVGTTLGRCVIVWEAVIDGEPVTWAQDARVVRRVVAYSLTASDVEQWSSYSVQYQPNGDADWTESLSAAWSLHMVPAMLAKGIQPERIVSWEVLSAWHIAALEWHLANITPEQDPGIRAEKKTALIEARDLALASSRFWVDVSDDLAKPEDSTTPQPWTVTEVTR